MDRAGDEVRSWFGDDDADRRRDMDQHRGKGPKGYTRSDDRIREDVCDRLRDDPRTDASDIEVSVSGGEVTLFGTVTDRGSKRSAEDCVDRVSGVQHVQNNLRVKQSASEGRNASASTSGAGQTAAAAKA
ncbi:BON domain-containing protein [Sphingomonas sp. ac-8]|uniref:BON domain-containing protein n=1 Tax=Sphingomonas sp. ac-8 TaxID=3242977 RepID=UPI003A7FDBA0